MGSWCTSPRTPSSRSIRGRCRRSSASRSCSIASHLALSGHHDAPLRRRRRAGTIETLLTAPIDSAGVVLGKFGAALVTYVAMWLPTVLYIVVLRRAGDIDWHVVGTSYAGVFLIGAGYLAVGTLMSAMTHSQLVALILSSLVILGLFVVGIGEFIFDAGVVHDFCAYVSVWGQMGELSKGIVDLRRLVLDATLIVLPLFVTVRAVDAWRWG